MITSQRLPGEESTRGDAGLEPLRGLRLGCVAYLNARPLIEPWGGPVHLDHPSALARGLARGELDAALVPVFEALRRPGFRIVDGVSISALGPVWSVFLAHPGRLEEVRTVGLDPASLTSVALCKVIFAEWGKTIPAYVPETASDADQPLAPGAGRVLIGNQAIEFRQRHGAKFHYLDFGEEWTRHTGLPFVFAVWLLRPDVPEPERVAGAFRELARQGWAQVGEIAARHPEHGAEFTQRYLTKFIRYGLGCAEKEAITRFHALLHQHGLLPEAPHLLDFR